MGSVPKSYVDNAVYNVLCVQLHRKNCRVVFVSVLKGSTELVSVCDRRFCVSVR